VQVATSLEFSIVSHTLESNLTVHLPLASFRELEEGERFEVGASFKDKCGILIY